ncbi:MAG: Acyltransferase [Ktedonobacterales bacterium]|jgi:peptidoglycan/LPS O-acetylase OafA/YrhL|nr:MAG: Acyltransferase [Ktedonobacterales bacterium]
MEASVTEEYGGKQVTRQSLEPLTGLRFLAALWVVVYHYTIEFRFTALKEEIHYIYGHHTPFDVLILQGHLAVDFFFLLSGFILAYTYTTTKGTLRGSRQAFWVARIARIYPVYLLGLLLAFWPYMSQHANPWDVVTSGVAHLLMIHAWLPSTLDWNQPSWSLSVEALFYALFPLLLPLFARQGRRGLWVLFIGSWLLFGLDMYLLVFAGGQTGLAEQSWWSSVVRYNPLVSLPEFLAGMALGLLFVKRSASTVSRARRMSGLAFDAVVIGVALCLAALLLALYKLGLMTMDYDSMAPFALPLLAALMYVLAFKRGITARVLSIPVVVWLGEISYGIYILHVPLWELLSGFAEKTFNFAPDNVIIVPVYGLLLLAVAGLSFRYIERPARRAIRARWGQPKRVLAPSVV